MARFTQYPNASAGDYENTTTFLIANEYGEIKHASLEGLNENFFGNIHSTTVTIPTASVLDLHDTPFELIPAVAGKKIKVLSANILIDYNSAAYTTNTDVELIIAGADVAQFTCSTVLAASKSLDSLMIPKDGEDDISLVENAGLFAVEPTANPATGNSDIQISILYQLI